MARIRHLAILTENVDKLVKFYTTAFGLKVVHGIGTATYLSDGHINLAIIPIGPEREIEGPQLQPGINHFGFEVEDVAAVRDACKEELSASSDVDKRPPNREAEFRVHDPDGNPIDLSKHSWPV
jgi:catechol 2,3-dioxygenase-like lactoylglutathione lyase family enzyme